MVFDAKFLDGASALYESLYDSEKQGVANPCDDGQFFDRCVAQSRARVDEETFHFLLRQCAVKSRTIGGMLVYACYSAWTLRGSLMIELTPVEFPGGELT